LTGAMRPFSLYASDGEFNLGGDIVAAQVLPAGVWGVMNGRVFAAEDLNKNVEQGRFNCAGPGLSFVAAHHLLRWNSRIRKAKPEISMTGADFSGIYRYCTLTRSGLD
jgi:L-asparaginase/Glu-tRNA(Gln) amidotransferase subunit D